VRQVDPMVELASGEYDRRKGVVGQAALLPVARLFGVPYRKLVNYRANYVSRCKPNGKGVESRR
jgi:hypothetical protein